MHSWAFKVGGMTRTLFPDEAIISVIGVVCIASSGAAAIADNAEVEF